MKNSFVSVPPLEVQNNISAFLDNKTERIDALILKTTGEALGTKALRDLSAHKDRSLCGQLMEYRAALITAAVIGKIKQLL
jgi:hypothetical protein